MAQAYWLKEENTMKTLTQLLMFKKTKTNKKKENKVKLVYQDISVHFKAYCV